MFNYPSFFIKLRIIFFILFFTSCSHTDLQTPAMALYEKTQITNKDLKIKKVTQEIINNTKAITLPNTQKNWLNNAIANKKIFSLTINDPIVNFDKFQSNYKLFSFNLKEGDEYTIYIETLCDCSLGFFESYRGLITPYILVMDTAGTILKQSLHEYQKINNSSIINKKHMLKKQKFIKRIGGEIMFTEINGISNKTDTYYLVLAADTTYLGERIIIKDVPNIYKHGGFPLPNPLQATYDPHGKFRVGIHIEKSKENKKEQK